MLRREFARSSARVTAATRAARAARALRSRTRRACTGDRTAIARALTAECSPCLRHGLSSFLSRSIDQRAADALARFVRLDHVVDEAAGAGDEGVGELRLVLGFARRELGRVALLLAEDDLDRALGAHHRDLGVRPGEVDVAAQVLGAHHVVGAAVGLARDHGDLGHRALGVGVEQLGAVLDDAAVLLRRAGHEAGHVDEGDDRDVERIAEAHEARRLDRALDVEAAGQHQRLVGDDADRSGRPCARSRSRCSSRARAAARRSRRRRRSW